MRIVIAALFAVLTMISVSAPAASQTKCSANSSSCSTKSKSAYAKKYRAKTKRYKKRKYAKKTRRYKKYSKRYKKKRYAKRYKKKRYAKRYKKSYKKRKYAKRYSKKYAKRYKKKRSTYRGSGGGTVGIASFYWQPQAVASGGRFNPNALTAAHKTLPFGTLVRVTHLGNGRSVTVRINDRGPYIKGRIIDLSRRAAGVIRMRGQGIAKVRIQVVGRSKKRRG